MTLSTGATRLICALNGVISEDVEVLYVQESILGRQPNYAILQARTNRPAAPGWPGLNIDVADFRFADAVGATVAIGTLSEVIHKGTIKAPRVLLRAGQQVVQYISVLDDFLFGRVLDGMEPIRQPDGSQQGGEFVIQQDVVFNPQLDGVLHGNRAHEHSGREGLDYPCFVDPDSTASEDGREYSNTGYTDPAERWTLAECVVYLCGRCANNYSNPLMRVPTVEEVESDLEGYSPPIENVRIDRGRFLPACLDQLLAPLGVAWFVEHTSLSESRLRLFRNETGGGAPVDLRLQPIGEVTDLDASDVTDLDLAMDAGDLANLGIAYTAPVELEATFVLKPGWDEEYDDAVLSDLHESGPEEGTPNPRWEEEPDLRNVWRKWVLNEAGDYKSKRSEEDLDEPFDLQPLVEAAIPWIAGSQQKVTIAARKRFLPTLTRLPHTTETSGSTPVGQDPGGVTIEWYNDADGGWQPIETLLDESGGHVRLLEDEAGIYFHGPIPPLELRGQYGVGRPRHNQIASGAIRITATLRCEAGVRILADQIAESVTPWEIESFTDGSHRWPVRAIHASSIYKDLVDSGLLVADVTPNDGDYFEGIRAEAHTLLEQQSLATITGEIGVWGYTFSSYPLGSPIRAVTGRQINLDCRPAGGSYPRVVAIGFSPQDQRTRLTVGTVRSALKLPRANYWSRTNWRGTPAKRQLPAWRTGGPTEQERSEAAAAWEKARQEQPWLMPESMHQFQSLTTGEPNKLDEAKKRGERMQELEHGDRAGVDLRTDEEKQREREYERQMTEGMTQDELEALERRRARARRGGRP